MSEEWVELDTADGPMATYVARPAGDARAAEPAATPLGAPGAPGALSTSDVSNASSASIVPSAKSAAGRDPASVEGGRALPTDPAAWPSFVAELKLAGIAGQLAAQSALVRMEGRLLVLAVPVSHKHLVDPAYADKLRLAIEAVAGHKLKLAFEVSEAPAVAETTLAAQDRRARAEQKAKTEAAFRDEPFVRDALARFGATIKPDSVKPQP